MLQRLVLGALSGHLGGAARAGSKRGGMRAVARKRQDGRARYQVRWKPELRSAMLLVQCLRAEYHGSLVQRGLKKISALVSGKGSSGRTRAWGAEMEEKSAGSQRFSDQANGMISSRKRHSLVWAW